MTILTSSVQEAYNQLLANSSNNFKGTWAITEDGYLSITGQSNGSIAMFSELGALKNFTIEWTSKQLGGSYIHSNLCPILRYTPEDLGIEGGGGNVAMILYLCSYTSAKPTGTIILRSESGNVSESHPETNASLGVNNIHSFKLVRTGSTLTFYQDGTLISTTTNLSSKPLYLGWYLWYGGSNSSYQTNFILQDYKLEGEIFDDAKKFLNKEGLKQVWKNIKDYHKSSLNNYYTKAEVETLISNITGVGTQEVYRYSNNADDMFSSKVIVEDITDDSVNTFTSVENADEVEIV